MPLYKRRSLNTGEFVTTGQTGQFFPIIQSGIFEPNFDTGLFVTTGQTGQFLTIDQSGLFEPNFDTGLFITKEQTGQFLTGIDLSNYVTNNQITGFFTGIDLSGYLTTGQFNNFTGNLPVFGTNPGPQNSGETIFSNSSHIDGNTQYSFFLCKIETQGDCFDGSLGNGTGYLNIPLTSEYFNQAWLIKNTIIAVGEHWNGSQGEQYATEITIVVKSCNVGSYSLTSPSVSLYAKSKPEFNVCAEATLSGIRYRLIDSPNTKMNWTSRVEITQTISQDIIFDGGIV